MAPVTSLALALALFAAPETAGGAEPSAAPAAPPALAAPAAPAAPASAAEPSDPADPVEPADSPTVAPGTAPAPAPAETSPETVVPPSPFGEPASEVPAEGGVGSEVDLTEPTGDDVGLTSAEDLVSTRERELRRTAERAYERGRFEEARRALQELVGLKPFEAGYHLTLGILSWKSQDPDEALRKYRDVLELAGDDVELRQVALLLEAQVHASRNDRQKAFDALRRAAEAGLNVIEQIGYLKELSVYRNDTEFIQLALSLERFPIRSLQARDPFLPSAYFIPTEVTSNDTIRGQVTLTAQEQQALVEQAKGALSRLLFHLRFGDDGKAMEEFLALRKVLDERDKVTVPSLERELQDLSRQLPDIETRIREVRLKYYYSKAREKLEAMKTAFAEEDYERVEQTGGELEKIADEMQKAHDSFQEVAARTRQAGQYWLERAHVRKEFEKRPLQIQGVVVSEDGNFVILNNRIVHAGDDFDDVVSVQSVEANRVTFRYKGESIPRVFRRY
ncbi:MAG: hypothetical protein JXP34_23715 [Planctomycetes bacterium]|nr:hypothetical protein [Planctomycetota bacterium]